MDVLEVPHVAKKWWYAALAKYGTALCRPHFNILNLITMAICFVFTFMFLHLTLRSGNFSFLVDEEIYSVKYSYSTHIVTYGRRDYDGRMYVLARAPFGGGAILAPPLWFFLNIKRTAARSAAKFSVPFRTSI